MASNLDCLDCCPAACSAGFETHHHIKKSDIDNFPTMMTTEIHNTTTTTNDTNRRRPSLKPTAQKTHVNPYHVLELRKDATPSEIVLSYRKLALFHHPGRKSKISCPLERKRRMNYFEMLAACYETLMHNEFRRRYDILLKDIEKQQQNTNNKKLNLNRQQPRLKHTSFHVIDSIPGLIPCSSQSSCFEGNSFPTKRGSDDTIPTTNCNSMMLICASPPICEDGVSNKNKDANSKDNDNFTISRDGTKGFRSLVDSASVSASQSEEEAEIHFSEATVNRLFGGPLASLHRARNFKAFSDPNEVFNKVFGNAPIFSSDKIEEINTDMTTSEDIISNELIRIYEDENGGNKISTQSSMLSQRNYSNLDGYSSHNNDNNNDNDDNKSNDQQQTTKVFVSSRVIHGRKITKTEIVHVDPQTSMASVNVTVDGEYLDISKSEKKSSSRSSGVGDWLLCFGTSTAKVSPLSCPSTMKNNCSINNNPCSRTATNNNVSGGDNVCEGFKSVYIEVLEEFYLCNRKFYEECNRYMSCGGDL